MWTISKLLQKVHRILLSTSLESSPRHSNNHLYLTNLLGYSLEGFFNTDNCQNYWQNLVSWSLVRRGLRGERATINTRMRAGQLLRHWAHPLQCYEQSNILQGPAPAPLMSCAGLNICDGLPGRRGFET